MDVLLLLLLLLLVVVVVVVASAGGGGGWTQIYNYTAMKAKYSHLEPSHYFMPIAAATFGVFHL